MYWQVPELIIMDIFIETGALYPKQFVHIFFIHKFNINIAESTVVQFYLSVQYLHTN